MAISFTREGIDVEQLSDVLSRLEAELKSVYGEDVDLSQNTPDGQRIGIVAKEVHDLEQFAALLYSQLDIDLAFGTFLDVLLKITGVVRTPASRSTAELTVTTDRELTLPAGYTVADTAGQNWLVEDAQSLVVGANTVSCVAALFGPVAAPAGTINDPVTFVLGVLSVTNEDPASAGRAEETEEQVRIRRNKSLEKAARGTLGAGLGEIASVNGVTDLTGHENKTNAYDSEKDIDPHTAWFIIEGGATGDIIPALARAKTGGPNFKGAQTGLYEEDFVRPNGAVLSLKHQVRWDRPNEVELHVRMTASRKDATSPIDTDLIKKVLSDRRFILEETVLATQLYSTAYTAGTNFVLTDMEISLDGASFTDEELFSGYGGKFVLDVGNITVTEA